MMNIFINRGWELSTLEDRYDSGRAELILIYGRRRVGKTYLIRRFLRGRRGVYLIVSRLNGVLESFAEAVAEQLGLSYIPSLRSYGDFYRMLGELSSKERLVVVVDEFQRLAEHDSSFLLELQEAWDGYLSSSRLMLILMGSSVGAVERVGLGPSSPIYGRRTAQIRVKPFGFSCAKEFFLDYSDVDMVRAYSSFGGVPGYLSLIDPEASLLENISKLILDRGGPLYEEPYFILAEETREPLRYMGILEAMSGGATTLGEIASKSGMASSSLPRYMRVLMDDLSIVERRHPLLEERRGRARYYLGDHYFRFWFRFVKPHLHLLELGEVDRVLEVVRRDIDRHASITFEDVAMEHFIRLAEGATRIGRWWRGGVEIDGVAIDESRGRIYFMEAKWSKKPVDRAILNDLIRKADRFPWRRGERDEIYVLYSRSGFTFRAGDNIHLIDLERLVEDLSCQRNQQSGSRRHP